MLGHPKRFDPLLALSPALALMFGAGLVLALWFPSLGWLAGWLLAVPVLLVGAALVFGVAAALIGRLLR
ncbi:hypothetical protein [Caldimonas sp.]|uniref:hypothetical protein n=1 Tax=Caldimonas sp. TaxID=2838790 RepID=UPI003919D753